MSTHFRTCPLCEATCGLEIKLAEPGSDRTVAVIRGDRDDVFSQGFICPKGTTLGHLHDDPDRVRRPLVKRDGEFVEVDWDEAFAVIADRLLPILSEHGRDACAIYLGNPGAHSIAPLLYNPTLIGALGSRNRFSASTVDQRPKEASAALMFGAPMIPVPDVDRTDYLLMLGANPYASNGSLCVAPGFPDRLDALRERGGRLVVVDPRRSETAERSDWHVAIRPGTDAYLLAAVATVLLDEGLAKPGRLTEFTSGLDELATVLAPYTPAAVAEVVGIDAADIVRLARELAAAPTAAVYGRIGTCTQEFGTLSSWLVDVVNLLTGNLDTEGGAVFATAATSAPVATAPGIAGKGRGTKFGRATSRVSSSPETFGEFSVAVLAEEIETPGEGQVRALITVAGNPVSSNPNADRVDGAIASLEFFVAIDVYVNETTRHADVILPPPSILQKSHYDVALYTLATHNVANYSPAILPLDDGEMSEWEIMLRLSAILQGAEPHDTSTVAELDEQAALRRAEGAVRNPASPAFGRDPGELVSLAAPRVGPERVLDVMLRCGPYGDGFGANPDGLTLAKLEAAPHGIDLGACETGRLPGILRTESGTIELLPEPIQQDLERLAGRLTAERPDMVLVGRRHVRSNNSWMHNIKVLMKGKNRCTMQIHPDDAVRLGITDGAPATVRSRVGEVTVAAEVTDVVRPGVVSIPHGFGQNLPGVQERVASEYRGVNTNVLTDESFVDAITRNIALNGVPVTVCVRDNP